MAKKAKTKKARTPEAVVNVKTDNAKIVPKEVVCPTCNGDCTWHSPKTGYRAKTASEALVDHNRHCAECDGTGHVTIQIPKAQADAEAMVKAKELAAQIKAIDAEAEAKKAAL